MPSRNMLIANLFFMGWMLRFGRHGPPKWTPRAVYLPLVGLLVVEVGVHLACIPTIEGSSVVRNIAPSQSTIMRASNASSQCLFLLMAHVQQHLRRMAEDTAETKI